MSLLHSLTYLGQQATAAATHLPKLAPPLMPILSSGVILSCVAASTIGALWRVAVENRRGKRTAKTNWQTLFLTAVPGVAMSLAASEALCRTQPWARDSQFLLPVACLFIGMSGQGVAMEANNFVTVTLHLVLERMKGATLTLFGIPQSPPAASDSSPDTAAENQGKES